MVTVAPGSVGVGSGCGAALPPDFGVGAAAEKSAELSSVSVPLASRWAEVELFKALVGEPSLSDAAPYPTRSTSAPEAS